MTCIKCQILRGRPSDWVVDIDVVVYLDRSVTAGQANRNLARRFITTRLSDGPVLRVQQPHARLAMRR